MLACGRAEPAVTGRVENFVGEAGGEKRSSVGNFGRLQTNGHGVEETDGGERAQKEKRDDARNVRIPRFGMVTSRSGRSWLRCGRNAGVYRGDGWGGWQRGRIWSVDALR